MIDCMYVCIVVLNSVQMAHLVDFAFAATIIIIVERAVNFECKHVLYEGEKNLNIHRNLIPT